MANVNLVQEAFQQAEARRIVLNEVLSKKESAEVEYGDYQASWKGHSANGRGKALYNGKLYDAKILGTASIPLNSIVKLTIAEYDFFVDW